MCNKRVISVFSAGKVQIGLAVLTVLFCVTAVRGQNLIQYVQPLAGTASSTTASALKHSEAGSEQNANTIPAVGVPFGMTQWVAQTRTTETKCLPPYYYKDSMLTGFRGTHWLSGSCTQDYGSFTVMPVVGKLKTKVDDYAVPFLHEKEITTPAFYSIELENISVAMTSTARCAMMQFTMQQDDSLYLLIIPNSDEGKGVVKVDQDNGTIWGYNPVHRIYQGWGQPAGFNGWVYMTIEKKITSAGTFSIDKTSTQDSINNGKNTAAYAGFYLKKGEQLLVRIGTSFSSMEGAKKNLEAEVGQQPFDNILTRARSSWEKALSQIEIQTADEKNKRIFYTAMYHAMQHPRLYNDVDGNYPVFSGNYKVNTLESGNYYDDFSMWDIYRAQLPLFEILNPGMINDFVISMIKKGEQGGWLPIFPCWNNYTSAMIGDHGTAFIASAFAKGIRNYDIEKAYELMRKNAFTVAGEKDYTNGMGRRALPTYLKYGYVPMEDKVPIAFHKNEQVSRTLEYAFDDYALGVIAQQLNKTEDYRQLRQRALNYKNVFDPAVGMVRGRHANGNWSEDFSTDKREKYITEGTPRQYTFYVPQDVPGLAGLMGGPAMLEKALDSLFVKDEYWHGNEPGHQIPFMYNYTASPWKTQKTVREILKNEYSDGPGGLSGNDDAGQMSAWYVFASIGFYPLNPVSGNYLITTPLFDHIKIRLPDNKTFEIVCHKQNENDEYIKMIQWNGKPYSKNYLQHAEMMKGGKLDIWLQPAPSEWGSKISDQPKGL